VSGRLGKTAMSTHRTVVAVVAVAVAVVAVGGRVLRADPSPVRAPAATRGAPARVAAGSSPADERARPGKVAAGRPVPAPRPDGIGRPRREDVQLRVRHAGRSLLVGARSTADATEFGAWHRGPGGAWSFSPLPLDLPYLGEHGTTGRVDYVGSATVGSRLVVVGQAALEFSLGGWLASAFEGYVPPDASLHYAVAMADDPTVPARLTLRTSEDGPALFDGSLADVGIEDAFFREVAAGGRPLVWVDDGNGGFLPLADLGEMAGMAVARDVHSRDGRLIVRGEDRTGEAVAVVSDDGGVTWRRAPG